MCRVDEAAYLSVLRGQAVRAAVRSHVRHLVEGVKRSLLGLADEDEGGKAVPSVRVVPVL